MLIVKVSGKDSSKVLKGKKKLAEGELKKKVHLFNREEGVYKSCLLPILKVVIDEL